MSAHHHQQSAPPEQPRSLPITSKLPPLQPGKRRIFLVRHGETDWNARGLVQGGGYDIELNDAGRDQAELVAEELAGVPLRVVASSHLRRAGETADIVWRRQDRGGGDGAERAVLEGLGEMRFGRFEGAALRGRDSRPGLMRDYQEWNGRMKLDATVAWPGGGESPSAVEERAKDALGTLLERHPAAGSHLCVVAHGRTINILLASLLRGDPRLFSKFRQRNCSVNVLDVCENGTFFEDRLLSYNDHIENPKRPNQL